MDEMLKKMDQVKEKFQFNQKEEIIEYICRNFLNRIFKKPFIKVRNIYNPVTHQYLELDCYNEELGLAIEYNGQQHVEYSPFFFKSKSDFNIIEMESDIEKPISNSVIEPSKIS